MPGEEFHGDHAAHRIAHHVRLLDIEVVEESDDVLHHFNSIGLILFGLARSAVTADIHCNDLVIFGQRFDYPRDAPIDSCAREEPVD